MKTSIQPIAIVFFVLFGLLIYYSFSKNSNNNKNNNSNNYQTQQSTSYKGNDQYELGYEHGLKGKTFGVSNAKSYCSEMSTHYVTISPNPTDAFIAGYNDAYKGNPSQY